MKEVHIKIVLLHTECFIGMNKFRVIKENKQHQNENFQKGTQTHRTKTKSQNYWPMRCLQMVLMQNKEKKKPKPSKAMCTMCIEEERI